MRVALTESLLLQKLRHSLQKHNVKYDVQCQECSCPPSVTGEYTLRMCTTCDDLVLVCDQCFANHRALHELSGEHVNYDWEVE
jgi:hypothetical protein